MSSRLRRTPFDIAAYQLISGKGMIGMDLIEEHRHQVHYTAGVIGANEITYCVLIWPDDYSGSGRMCVWRFSQILIYLTISMSQQPDACTTGLVRHQI